MIEITKAQLQQIMLRCTRDRINECFPHFIDACEEYGINTPMRLAAFIAQTAHESMSWMVFRELWGPTAQQKKYEPPSKLATDLGNTQHGDGKRYRGRGALQITGRANYQHVGKVLGIDLIEAPEMAELLDYAFHVAGVFWLDHDLNDLADKGMMRVITKRINGGLNGIAERMAFYEKAMQVLTTK